MIEWLQGKYSHFEGNIDIEENFGELDSFLTCVHSISAIASTLTKISDTSINLLSKSFVCGLIYNIHRFRWICFWIINIKASISEKFWSIMRSFLLYIDAPSVIQVSSIVEYFTLTCSFEISFFKRIQWKIIRWRIQEISYWTFNSFHSRAKWFLVLSKNHTFACKFERRLNRIFIVLFPFYWIT